MNVQEEFEKFYFLLKKQTSNIYINEMVDEIEESEVLFHPPSKLKTRHLFKIYTDRFNMQKEVTKHNLVEGWSETLNNLEEENDEYICIVSLVTKTASYIVFISTLIDRTIGVLKSRNNDLKKAMELRKLYGQKKLAKASSRRFERRIMQSD